MYKNEKVFQDAVNECCDLLKPMIEEDLRTILFLPNDDDEVTKFSLKNCQRNPAKRSSPAAIMAAEPGLMIMVLVQPYKKPHIGPSPRLR